MSPHFLFLVLALAACLQAHPPHSHPFSRAGKKLTSYTFGTVSYAEFSPGNLPFPIVNIITSDPLRQPQKRIITFADKLPPFFQADQVKTPWFGLDTTSSECPAGSLVNEVWSWGPYWQEMRLGCAKLQDSYYIQDNDSKIVSQSEEGACPDTYYLSGVGCRDYVCDQLVMKCVRVYSKWDSAGVSVCDELVNPSVFEKTPHFSEENGGKSQWLFEPISGVECYGRRCDNKSLVSLRSDMEAVVNRTESYWTPWFTDNGGSTYAICSPGHVVSMMKCRKSYCDDMSLNCAKLSLGFQVVPNTSYTLPRITDEQKKGHCGTGDYVTGVKCLGHYCAVIVLTCAQVRCV